ncbi:hypothetical protein ACRYCC_39075 [Actinomadura scrupuli]|uniref:hypothetical protein n=1 Tax=Actinomadura scrupuli TaxID=559629 RepID=UPI003D9536E8
MSASVVKSAISVLRTEGLVIGQQGKGVLIRDQGETGPPAPADVVIARGTGMRWKYKD